MMRGLTFILLLLLPLLTKGQTFFDERVEIEGLNLSHAQALELPDGRGSMLLGQVRALSQVWPPEEGIHLLRLDEQMQVMWSRFLTGAELYSFRDAALSLDGKTIYISALARNVKDGQQGAVVIAVDVNGNPLWSKWMENTSGYTFAYDIFVNSEGDLLVLGMEGIINSIGHYSVAKMDAATGAVLAARKYTRTYAWGTAALDSRDRLMIYGIDANGISTHDVVIAIEPDLQVRRMYSLSYPTGFGRTGLMVGLQDGQVVGVVAASNAFYLLGMDSENGTYTTSRTITGRIGGSIFRDALDNIYVSAMSGGVPVLVVFNSALQYQRTYSLPGTQGVSWAGMVKGCGGGLLFPTVQLQNGVGGYHLSFSSPDSSVGCGLELSSISTSQTTLPTISPESKVEQSYSLQSNDYPVTITDAPYQVTRYCEASMPFTVDLGPDTALCPGEELNLTSGLSQGRHRWSTGSTNDSITVSEAGIYSLQVTESCGLAAADTIAVAQHPSIAVDFTYDPEDPQPYEPILFTSTVPEAEAWWWQVEEEDSIAGRKLDWTFYKSGWYPITHTILDSNGCSQSATDSMLLDLTTCYLPNAISKNGDGLNEVFEPQGFGIESYFLEVYNRWGEKVFEGRSHSWPATDMPEGVYLYRVEVTFFQGDKRNLSGNVTVVR